MTTPISTRLEWIAVAREHYTPLKNLIAKFIGLNAHITPFGNPTKYDVEYHLKWARRNQDWDKFARYLQLAYDAAPNAKGLENLQGWAVLCDLLAEAWVLGEKESKVK